MRRKTALPLAFVVLAALTALGLATPAAAQTPGVTLPPDGDNQRSWATQQIGPVKVSLEYSSPNVHSPTGEDRRGKIWGGLVPYGLANLGFGTCGDQCPWRGGANENTVFTTSHDIKVQGETLPAGAYGLHFIPGQEEWTVIFSKNHTSWGSFTYDAKEDALRVKAKPEKNDYHEWLTYEFTDRETDHGTVALMWEDLKLPLALAVPDAPGLWVESMRRELRNNNGFTWQSWNAAAQYCAQNKVNLEEGLRWAQVAVSRPFIGQENFNTLLTLAMLEEANGKAEEAKKTREQALNHRSAGPIDLHQYARGLQAQGKNDEAIGVYELNAKRFPDQWPVNVGMARAAAARSNQKQALEYAKKAMAQAPDDNSKKNLETLIQKLEKGEKI